MEKEVRRPAKSPNLGFFVYFLAFMAVIGGFFFGYDCGIVSGSMLFLSDYEGMKPMTAMWKQLIVSIAAGMSMISSLAAGPLSDRFGRKKIILSSSALLTIGGIISCAAINKPFLLVGRIFIGIAVGFASMIGPIYVGEASPTNIRGTLATGYQLMVTSGLTISTLVAACFSYVNATYVGWRLMLGCAAVPSALQFFGFLFLPESPRFLYNKGFREEAKQVLEKIYNKNEEWIEYEMAEIEVSDNKDKKAKSLLGDKMAIQRIFETPHVRKALTIGCTLQLLQQFAGVNTIIYYTSTIITAAGVDNAHTTLWISLGISVFNFAGTLIPLGLVERFGRRLLLLISVAGVDVSLILMGVSFLLINKDSPNALEPNSTIITSIQSNCQSYSNCDYCVTDENCGFCHIGNDPSLSGDCVPMEVDSDFASLGNCVAGFNSTAFLWEQGFCKTRFTVMPVVIIVLYLTFFEMGFAPLAFVLNAEFYPLWARSIGCGLSTAFNWAGNLIISLTFLSLTQAASKFGIFFIYAGITAIGFVIFLIFIPETKGLPIEQVEMLFMSKQERQRVQERLQANECEYTAGKSEKINPLA